VEGAVAALPIWADLVQAVPQYISGDWFMAPPGVVKRKICSQSGQLAIESKCPEPFEEVFLTENIPAEYCKIPEHQIYSGGTWKKWWKKVWRK
jgi:penicillin-binding protein 1B